MGEELLFKKYELYDFDLWLEIGLKRIAFKY
jgi:hypothetical protein